MNENEFKNLEYPSLREEIRETKTRLFRIAGFALVGLPVMSGASRVLDIQEVVLLLPGFISATVLLYISESSALMRCGTYIRENYESEFTGWESWLASKEAEHDYRRQGDKLTFWFFIVVFGLYYLLAGFMGVVLAYGKGPWFGVASIVLYIIIVCVISLALMNNYDTLTQTKKAK